MTMNSNGVKSELLIGQFNKLMMTVNYYLSIFAPTWIVQGEPKIWLTFLQLSGYGKTVLLQVISSIEFF